LCEGA